MVAVTLLSELQNGQENATSSFGLTFLGGGFDDFLLPMAYASLVVQDSSAPWARSGLLRKVRDEVYPRCSVGLSSLVSDRSADG